MALALVLASCGFLSSSSGETKGPEVAPSGDLHAPVPTASTQPVSGASASALHNAPEIVDQLSFQRFKDNIQDLANFGDRFRGTASNRSAGLWIEKQLAEAGYVVERHTATSSSGPLDDNIYATKVGSGNPDQMYIVSAHFDGRGGGGGADDDASGSSLVLEMARALAPADVWTDRSVRFVFWNYEEGGCLGSARYVSQRRVLQGVEDPPGSGIYPEPTWLGVIQHDMILFDHGLPPTAKQSPSADLDIEYDGAEPFQAESLALANLLVNGNGIYSTDYPAETGSSMCCTDSRWFDDFTAAVSVRENKRRDEIGEGSNPNYHRSTDVFSSYSDADFRLGFNALQMSLGTVCELVTCRTMRFFFDGFETGDTSAWSQVVP